MRITYYYIIKQNKRSGLYEVWESFDKGRSGTLVPRIDVKTDENCYHESIESAEKWINETRITNGKIKIIKL